MLSVAPLFFIALTCSLLISRIVTFIFYLFVLRALGTRVAIEICIYLSSIYVAKHFLCTSSNLNVCILLFVFQ